MVYSTAMPPSVESEKPVVAVYLRYYLSPSETFVYRQLKGMSEGFRTVVLTSKASNLDLFPTEQVFVKRKGFLEKAGTRLFRIATGSYSTVSPAQAAYWRRTLLAQRARLVHAHFGHFGLDVLPTARSLGIPLLVTFHGFDASRLLGDPRYVRALEGLFRYAHVVTVSENMAMRLAPFGLERGRATVHYIGAPVEEFDFVERPALRDKSSRCEPITFLQVSNFVEKKGHRFTIEAFARYLRERPRDRLVLAGDGPLRGEAASLCSEAGIRERVEFAGRVAKPRILELMRGADVFVHHSVTAADGDMEGIPTVIMEAMATGLVVVSTRHSGIPELVDDGIDGFLVDERDVDGYVERLRGLGSAGAAIGRAAREKIEEKFNMSKQNGKLRELYQRAIDGKLS
jgi:glycosyltransferase involved in cell wall biosynthesis